MWGTILSTSLITLLIMVLLHQTYNHLQATLTVPKVSDLVRRPEQKYREINEIIDNKNDTETKTRPKLLSTSTLPSESSATEMKDELRTFLTRLRH
jgi:hypothetical protein